MCHLAVWFHRWIYDGLRHRPFWGDSLVTVDVSCGTCKKNVTWIEKERLWACPTCKKVYDPLDSNLTRVYNVVDPSATVKVAEKGKTFETKVL